MKTIFLKLLRLLQKRCEHPSEAVKADLLEGDAPGIAVQWCEICGAHAVLGRNGIRRAFYEFRRPRPDYHTAKAEAEIRAALRLREERRAR